MTHPIRTAWLARDVAGVVSCFRDDGVFHSPVISAPGFVGSRSITRLMDALFEVTSDTEFTFEALSPPTQVHGLNTRFNGVPVKGLVEFDVDEAGLIHDLWVYARPLTGVVAVSAAMGPALARQQSPALGVSARAGIQPLVALAKATDAVGRRLVRHLNQPVGRPPAG